MASPADEQGPERGAASPEAARGPADSALLDFATSVITPGYHHPWASLLVNVALGGLVVTLVLVLLSGAGNGHHVAMLLMALGLWAAINWLMVEAFGGDRSAQKKKTL